MKFWVLDAGQRDAQGPYEIADLKKLPGFSGDSIVAPDGANDPNAWRPARSYEEIRGQFVKSPPSPMSSPPPLPSPTASAKSSASDRPVSIIVFGLATIFFLTVFGIYFSSGTSTAKKSASPEDTAKRAAEDAMMKKVPSSTRVVESQVLRDMGRPLSLRADSPVRLFSVCVMVESKDGSAGTALGTYVALVLADASGNTYTAPDNKGSEPIKVSDSREGRIQFSCDDVRNSGKF